MKSDLVWYASYGSNLLRARFMAYIQGGAAPGARFAQMGCSDSTPPKAERQVLLHHPLFFAESSPQWENQAIAFIGKDWDEAARSLGRMYLISRNQFREVFLQDHRHRQLDMDVGMDLEKTIQDGESLVPGGAYDTLLYLGEEEGHPIFTFTGSWSASDRPLTRPGPKYLTVIARGLQETFGLSDQGVVDYLKDVPGIQGVIPEEELAGMLRMGWN